MEICIERNDYMNYITAFAAYLISGVLMLFGILLIMINTAVSIFYGGLLLGIWVTLLFMLVAKSEK